MDTTGDEYYSIILSLRFHKKSGAVAESVEHWSRVREIVGSNPGRVKPMTYKIDICHFLARCSALLG